MIDVLDDKKGGWRFAEHGKPKEAISVDDIEAAIAYRRDGFGWRQIAAFAGHTSFEIQQAVNSYLTRQQAESEDRDQQRGRAGEARAASPDKVRHDDADGRDELALNDDAADHDYDDWRRRLSNRHYERQKAERRARVAAWLKSESDEGRRHAEAEWAWPIR